ncbi:MAG: ribonuclease HI [Chloroflexi bacterium]|nr:ribonuclease HI [Chloroflexota bacterium]
MPQDTALSLVEIYTDGACDPNPGPGGWGAVLVSGPHTREISGAEPRTTNNRMELTAAIEALRLLKRPCQVVIHTDSEYLQRGITEWLPNWQRRGWRLSSGGRVENQDLWQALLAAQAGHEVTWRWVRGHAGHPLNERADRLATEARRGCGGRSAPLRDDPREPAPPRSEAGASGGDLPRLALYSRGCALGAPGPSGYAAMLVPEGDPSNARSVSGWWPLATNNVMDLWAVIAGLRVLEHRTRVHVYSPSRYVVEGATRWLANWERRHWRTEKGAPVKNRELWEELSHVMGDHDVAWHVLDDANNPHSLQAAGIARQEAESARQEAAGKGGAEA